MPNVFTMIGRVAVAGALLVALPRVARAQQPDSAAARDSVLRADSLRADSVRQSELARIRGEVRAPMGPLSPDTAVLRAAPQRMQLSVDALSFAGDMIADLSPRAAARAQGSRIRLRDIEGSVNARYGPRLSGLLTLTLADDGAATRVVATDAAVAARLPVSIAEADLIIGLTAFPFGRAAQLHRHAQVLPDQPLPIRVLLGADGLRGTGIQLRSARTTGTTRLSLDLAIADRFGERVDSLHPAEPGDQSLAGVAAGGRVGASFHAARTQLELGVSSVSGKREQPVGCVYEGTVGPVPCPEGVNAANTRLTVFGADARAGWGMAGDRLVVSGEWLRMVVGATDLPVFTNSRFGPFYKGVIGTYDGGYVDARLRLMHGLAIGGRGEWMQNPEVRGLNDRWAGGYIDVLAIDGARLTASYQRRVPSAAALAAMTRAEQASRDRVVIRGTVSIGRHPSAGLD